MPGVEPFVDDDPRVLPQLPGELAVTDIDGVDALGTTGQQHVGEAAGRSPDIKRDLVVDRDVEMIERVYELDPAAGNPRMVASLERQRRIRGEALAGLIYPAPGAADEPGEDQRLGLGAAFNKTLVKEELIGPSFFGSHGSCGSPHPPGWQAGAV